MSTVCDNLAAQLPGWVPKELRDVASGTCVNVVDPVLLSGQNAFLNAQHEFERVVNENLQLQGIIQGLQNDLRNAGDFSGQLVGKVASSIRNARAGQAVVEAFNWMQWAMPQAVPLFNPAATNAERERAWSVWQPLAPNGTMHQLMFSREYEDAADAVAVLTFGSVGASLLASLWPLLLMNPVGSAQLAAVQASNLSLKPTPYLELLRLILDAPNTIKNPGDAANLLIRVGQKMVDLIYGVTVSAPTALLVGIEVVAGLPKPNVVNVYGLIAGDTVFRAGLKRRLGVILPAEWNDVIVDRTIPTLATCIGAANPDGFFRCAEKVIDLSLPGLVKKLRDRGVNLSDARVVVNALWKSDGNFALAFDKDTPEGKVGLASLMALGAVGIITLAEVFGQKNTMGWFQNVFGPIVPADVFKNLQKALTFTQLAGKVYNDYSGTDLAPAFNGSDFFRNVMVAMNDASWKFEDGLALIKARGIFESTVTIKNGQPAVTPSMKTLLETLHTWATTERGMEKLGKTLTLFCPMFQMAGISASMCGSTQQTQQDKIPQATPSGVKSQSSLDSTPKKDSTPKQGTSASNQNVLDYANFRQQQKAESPSPAPLALGALAALLFFL